MLVENLDGNKVKWVVSGLTTNNKSGPHLLVRTLLHSIFPSTQILEEVAIPVKRGQTLYLDFYIPLFKIVVEINGAQHRQFVPHFHGNQAGFAQSKRRDANKKQWCELNSLKYIVLDDNEDEDTWRMKLS